MRKIILLTTVVSNMVFAGSAEENARIQTMQNLETALGIVQQGFMYNNRSMIANGIKKLKYNASDIQSFKIPGKTDYAQSESKAIVSLADTILKDFDARDKDKVLDSYKEIQNKCITCHIIVRKW